MPELLDAVQALTRVTHTKVIQIIDTENGEQTQTNWVTHEPLLDQLENAIRGEMSHVPGSTASLKSNRSVIDGDALFQFVRVSNQIAEWSRLIDAPRRNTPASQLDAWLVAYEQTNPDEAGIRWHVRKMEGWAATIRDKLDPAVEHLLPDPCPNPECPQGVDGLTGRSTWWDQKTRERYTDPLVVRFRRDDEHLLANARARCRACGTEWGARALAWELEHAEDEKRITTV